MISLTNLTCSGFSTTVTLPLRIVSVANIREHWAAKAKRTRSHRTTAALVLRIPAAIARAMLGKKSPRARFEVRLVRIAPGTLDTDNLASAFKAVRDGVADALGVSDADSRVLWTYTQERSKPRHYAARIEIRGVQ